MHSTLTKQVTSNYQSSYEEANLTEGHILWEMTVESKAGETNISMQTITRRVQTGEFCQRVSNPLPGNYVTVGKKGLGNFSPECHCINAMTLSLLSNRTLICHYVFC